MLGKAGEAAVKEKSSFQASSDVIAGKNMQHFI